ncbi:hypothetical protein PIB30_050917, partial [Stylosanthes scabra]|nr:hypothetical protein [Stylosanthes scabra]
MKSVIKSDWPLVFRNFQKKLTTNTATRLDDKTTLCSGQPRQLEKSGTSDFPSSGQLFWILGRPTPALLVHIHLSHKPPTFRLDTSDYAGSPKFLEVTSHTIRSNLRISENRSWNTFYVMAIMCSLKT